jgi:hypothetical protein
MSANGSDGSEDRKRLKQREHRGAEYAIYQDGQQTIAQAALQAICLLSSSLSDGPCEYRGPPEIDLGNAIGSRNLVSPSIDENECADRIGDLDGAGKNYRDR